MGCQGFHAFSCIIIHNKVKSRDHKSRVYKESRLL
jgi:hypothetical protein